MKVLWTTLEYGARTLSVLLIALGTAWAFLGGCCYLIGEATQEPFPLDNLGWVIFCAPFFFGLFLYVLSGLCKAMAEE